MLIVRRTGISPVVGPALEEAEEPVVTVRSTGQIINYLLNNSKKHLLNRHLHFMRNI